MGDFLPTCGKCGSAMSRGHVPDMSHGQVLQSSWAPGDPEPRRFIGGIKWKENELVSITAYRCGKCGFLELYAKED
ncbi:MAG: hypothetical protein ABJE47_15570 [bacterium]